MKTFPGFSPMAAGRLLTALCLVTVSLSHAQNLVQNGTFTANAPAFVTYPGYAGSGGNPAGIASWSNLNGGGLGVNGAAVGFAGSPFGPVNAGGNTYAFIQTGPNGLAQTLTLAANTLYQLSFDAAGRAGNTAQFQVRAGGTNQIYFDSGSVAGNNAAFTHFYYSFITPGTLAGPVSLQLNNLTAGDNTVAFANVVVSAIVPATFTWTALAGGNASGSWATQANWTGGTLPTSTAASVLCNTLDIVTDSTVTLDGNPAVGALTFADADPSTPANWILNAGSPAASMLWLGGANPLITVTNLGGSSAAIINAVIGGTNGLTKTGTSYLQLNAANIYSGGTLLSGADGRLSAGNDHALGTGLVTVGATPGAGQVWLQASGNRTLTNDFEIRAVRWIIDNATVNGVASGNLTVNGNVLFNTGSSGARDIYCNANLTLNGNVAVTPTTNPINKQGGYVLTLNGTNTVGGASAVNGGTLVVNGPLNGGAPFTVNAGGVLVANGAVNGFGTVTVNAGGTLSGTGAISGVVTVAGGGNVTPGGGGGGSLACGRLISAAGSIFNFNFGATNNPNNTLIKVGNGVTLAGTLNITDRGGFSSGVYTGLQYSGALTLNGFTNGLIANGKTVLVDTTSAPGHVLFDVLNGTLNPAAGQNVPMDLAAPLPLGWVQVWGATAYDVYLGTVSNAVASATTNTAGIYQGRTGALTLNLSSLQPDTTYYWRVDGVAAGGTLTKGTVLSFTTGAPMVDLMEDTWVATDALNRSLPGLAECGSPRTNRPIGLFYYLWQKYARGLAPAPTGT